MYLTALTRTSIVLFLFVITSALVTPAFASPQATGKFTEFAIPTPNSEPYGITRGPDGNFWFVEAQNPGKIGRVTPGGKITEFPLPSQSLPESITAGPDGNLWFTARGTSSVGRITPGGSITLFANAPGIDITAGPDGNLWFTMIGGVGRITPAGQLTLFHGPSNELPLGITTGPDGNLWFVDRYAEAMCKVDPSTGQITVFHLPNSPDPRNITRGPAGDSHLWFTGRAGIVGRFDLATNQATLLPVSGDPAGITASQGFLWFTDIATGAIDRMSLSGKVTAFPLPHTGGPAYITTGPGTVWFTDYSGNRIGDMTTQ